LTYGDGGQRPREFRTVVGDIKALATVLAMEAESVLGRRAARALGVLALFAIGVVVLFLLLNGYINPTKPGERKDLVLVLAQILGGAALLSGLYFTWRALQVNREGQITDRFTRAIEQLGAREGGEKQVEIRLGGIYALERMARDSERDCWTIAEVLSGYIRQNARWSKGKLSPDEDSELSSQLKEYKYVEYQHRDLDIQAALDVIKVLLEQCIRPKGRRALRRLYLNRTDLSFGDLREANLEEARFRNANLWGIRLDKSNLRKAHLRGAVLKAANLRGTNFEKADLEGANFEKARLNEANFEKARLNEATFKGANLHETTFSDAKLHGADLRGAKHLTQAQLEVALGDKNTQLPTHLKLPTHWSVKTNEQIEGS
jgi:uncharacterized protein YjbI with pentapeptide repeats